MSKIKNWQLPILAVIVSVLSFGLIYQYAQAQWQNPGQLPGQTGPGVIVVNPMTTNLDLSGKNLFNGGDISAAKITASGNVEGSQVCIGVDCRATWPTGFWQAGAGNKIHYSTDNVGIGISDPANPLHIYRLSGQNAEIKLQSDAGNSWGIYQHRSENNQLIFWNNTDRVYFSTDGKVGINKSNPNYYLDVFNNTANSYAIYGQTQANFGRGVAGNFRTSGGSVSATGFLGVRDNGYASGVGIGVLGVGETSGAIGVYGQQVAATGKAGYFVGNVELAHVSGQVNYLTIHHKNGPPDAGHCDINSKGKMLFDHANSRLYICNTTWKYVDLQ
ncbi:MAG: hypothetical protein PHO91_02600 [Patescibacteria group bacterium]|nr:hypothetical protein [Patescibacteria group bacterium]